MTHSFLTRRQAASVVALCCTSSFALAGQTATSAPTLTGDAACALQWVTARRDNRDRAFAIVDKKEGKIYVFDRKGRLAGTSPALVGKSSGDMDEPGVGHLEVSQLTTEQRKTPAGRFNSLPAADHAAEIIWFDYDAGLAIHQLASDSTYVPRMSRLRSPDPAGRRITAGCVAVPVEFFAKIVRPVLGARAGVVYVLPDTLPINDFFPAG
ncbi:L,D-transpeptidase [Caenimonas terrae]|uniref:L,D-transpeptidase n=1 Tax=Caenimonas terrae TaxID=696074 RepID=A0ABW0NFI3_9BURK